MSKENGLMIALPKGILLEPMVTPKTWATLAWSDVVQSYRRTFLGPLWITLNMAIFSFAMTLVYGALFGIPTREYAAYVVCGMISWMWLSAIIIEGGGAFLVYSQYIVGMPIDKSKFVWTVAFKQIIVLLHNLVVYIFIVVIGVVDINAHTLMIIPSVVLLFISSIPIIAILSILYIRYRDLQKLMGSVIIIFLLLSPIFWQPHLVSGWRSAFVHYNPIYYFIEFIRAPLLGQPIPLSYYLVLVCLTAFLWAVGGYFYRKYERFVIYWT